MLSWSRYVIPMKMGIQCFQGLLDAPVSGTPCQARGRLRQALQVRHDGITDFMDGPYIVPYKNGRCKLNSLLFQKGFFDILENESH